MKVPVLLLLVSLCFSLALAWQTDTESGSGRPYHYGEESFRHWTRSRQGRFRVLERFTHELLEDAVGNYRVAGEAAGVRGGRGAAGGPCHRSTEGRRLPARAPEPQGLVGVSSACLRCSGRSSASRPRRSRPPRW
ncbi:Globulin-2 [Zea mays]|uniref:Globulin-2 n=1 Tax=Zea mays TaxID=4577 RepID=A0A1D6L7G3_MAIZE|nr:Globulin-2 [Zea mays]